MYLSAPWSLGKVNVPLNQTSGRPGPLSAGRRCSLPAEFKVHSHLLPETYPKLQNGGRYALIKLSGGGFDGRSRWGLDDGEAFCSENEPHLGYNGVVDEV